MCYLLSKRHHFLRLHKVASDEAVEVDAAGNCPLNYFDMETKFLLGF
jgi:hypothetical protein